MHKRGLYFLMLLELIWFTAGLASAKFGVLYLDEAWYLTASHLVSEGQILYRDFAFTQGPVLPYVYGICLALLGTNIAIGRFLSVAFSTLALALVLNIAHRFAGMWAAVLAFLLLFATPDVLYFLAIVKTYSLVAVFTLWSLALVLHSGSSRSALWPILSTVVAGLAVLTRLSFLPVLVFIFVFWIRRGRWKASGLGLLPVVLGTLILVSSSNGNMLYDAVGFHLRNVRDEAATWRSMVAASLEIAIVYSPALVWLFSLLGLWQRVPEFRRRMVNWWRTMMDSKVLLALVAIALAIVHFVQAADGWEYHIPAYLLMVILLAAISASVIEVRLQPVRTLFLGLLVIVYSVNIWGYVLTAMWDPTSTLLNASKASEILAQRGRPGDTFLGGLNHLALASGLQIYPGNEMGMFSVADESSPDWKLRHFLSLEAVTEALTSCSATFVATQRDALFRVTIPSVAEIPKATGDQWMELLRGKYQMIYSDRDTSIFERVEEKCRDSSRSHD